MDFVSTTWYHNSWFSGPKADPGCSKAILHWDFMYPLWPQLNTGRLDKELYGLIQDTKYRENKKKKVIKLTKTFESIEYNEKFSVS